MGKSRWEWLYKSPMPATLDDAHLEIANLRQQLNNQNQQLERMAEKKELMRRSLLGSIRAMEKRFGVKVVVDKGLPQGEVRLKSGDQIIETIHFGIGE